MILINLLSIIIIFSFFYFLYYLFDYNKKKKNVGYMDLLKNLKTQDYEAKIYQKNENDKENNILNQQEFKLTNIRIGDVNGSFKEIFKFNEKIYVYLDYELPKNKYYFFNIELDSSILEENRKLDLNKYIKRVETGNTEKYPIIFIILGNKNDEEINIKTLKIVVYEAGDFEVPVYNINKNVNIIIEPEDQEILEDKIDNNDINLKINENNINDDLIPNIDERIECLDLIDDLYKKYKMKSPGFKNNLEKI